MNRDEVIASYRALAAQYRLQEKALAGPEADLEQALRIGDEIAAHIAALPTPDAIPDLDAKSAGELAALAREADAARAAAALALAAVHARISVDGAREHTAATVAKRYGVSDESHARFIDRKG
jgi:hypothetical protein